MRIIGLRWQLTVIPVLLSVVGALCETAVMCLLIPLVDLLLDVSSASGTPAPVALNFGTHFALPLPDLVLAYGRRGAFAFTLFLTLAFMGLRIGAEFLGGALLSRSMLSTLAVLRTRLFTRYLAFGKAFSEKVGVSRIASMLQAQTGEVISSAMSARALLTQAVMLLGYVLLLISISWKLFCFSLLLYPAYRFVNKLLSKEITRASEKYYAALIHYGDVVANSSESLPMIIAYDAGASEVRAYDTVVHKLADEETAMERRVLQLYSLQELLTPIMIVILVGTLALSSFLRSDGGGAQSLVFFLALRRISNAANVISNYMARLKRTIPTLEEIVRVEGEYERYVVPSGKTPCPSLSRGIEVRGLAFSYGDGSQALRDVSFTIAKGKTTAIVGRTGSGKSTILGLLQRLYAVEPGMISFDGIDLTELEISSLRSRFGVVSQEVYVRNDSMRNNLLFGARTPRSDEELIETLRRVRLDAFFGRLAQGLDTPLGTRGVGLSGGERQRLAIARALLRQPEILILDEATSSLDRETESQVKGLLDELMHGRTSIVVAHRLSTIANADHIVALENGVVIEQGGFQELMARGGYFAESFNMQNFGALKMRQSS